MASEDLSAKVQAALSPLAKRDVVLGVRLASVSNYPLQEPRPTLAITVVSADLYQTKIEIQELLNAADLGDVSWFAESRFE